LKIGTPKEKQPGPRKKLHDTAFSTSAQRLRGESHWRLRGECATITNQGRIYGRTKSEQGRN